jgi:hypothetical protein
VSTDLERDLGAWTTGELTRERLLATHGAAAAGTVALHDRLTEAASSTTVPDAEAGWAALLVAMDAPAPVVPLRRHVPRRRTVALLVAATLVLAGTAFAAKLGLGHRVPPAPASGSSVVGPSGGSTFVGTNDRRLVPPPAGSGPSGPHPHDETPSASGGETGTGGGTSSGDGGAPTSTDDPHDRDHGTGNDGSHDDQGGGNDGSTGSLPGGSNGHGH